MFKKLYMILLLICFMVSGIVFKSFTNADTKGHDNDKQKEQLNVALEQNGANTEHKPIKAKIQEGYGKLPLYFIENHGQVDKKIRFYEKGNGHAVYFTKKGVCFSLIGSQRQKARVEKQEARSKKQDIEIERQAGQASRLSINAIARNKDNEVISKSEIRNPKSETVRLIPLGANKNPEIVAQGLLEGKVNYLIGNNPKKWTTNIPTYKSVVYKDIYENIDMKFYGNNRQMEYDIIVKPGANPSRVQLAYQGVEGLRITEEGGLEVIYKGGKFQQKRPYVYQEICGKRMEVQGEFKIHNSRATVRYPKSKIRNPKFIYGFRVTSYDKRYPLIIDPALVYSIYLGGSNQDNGNGIAMDTSGNAYISGAAFSIDFPTTNSAFREDHAGGEVDAFITKLDASGSSLVYSTYLGGSDWDEGYDIAVDTSGNAYITGLTKSTNFGTESAFQVTYAGGGADAFVTKLDASGSSLVYSTYLGGNDWEEGLGIAVDTSGNAYITGDTTSNDFPTKSALYGTYAGGDYDAFVTKLDASGSSMVYSTYLGGSEQDFGYGIAVDTSGNSYVTGRTKSTDFPTESAFQGTYAGGERDVFITKLDASGSSLAYSTYLGGSERDYGSDIAVDTLGNAYITGTTKSMDFPIESALYGTYAGGDYDAFVTKLDASGSSLLYSTYLGGSDWDESDGIAVDTSGNAYIAGDTTSTNFPSVSAIEGTHAGGERDAFVTKLEASGSSLVYSTYLGGSDWDEGRDIAVDISGNAYITGLTLSADFPTASVFYGTNTGSVDVFVTAITLKNVPTVATGLATEVKYNSAILNGIVNANGLSTTAWFEYDTTSESLSAKSSEVSIDGTSTIQVDISVSELSEDTLYYYRLVAENSEGIVGGGELSFVTNPCLLTSITLPEKRVTLSNKKNNEAKVLVTATGEDNCPIKGKEITSRLDKKSKKFISVKPKKTETDINGNANFKIKAKDHLGIANVTFEADGIESETLTVKIKR